MCRSGGLSQQLEVKVLQSGPVLLNSNVSDTQYILSFLCVLFSRGDMKKLSRGDEELKTIRMINKGHVALTLGGLSLLLLLALIRM